MGEVVFSEVVESDNGDVMEDAAWAAGGQRQGEEGLLCLGVSRTKGGEDKGDEGNAMLAEDGGIMGSEFLSAGGFEGLGSGDCHVVGGVVGRGGVRAGADEDVSRAMIGAGDEASGFDLDM